MITGIRYSENAATGGDNAEDQVWRLLKDSLSRARSIDIVVSFLMESGVRLMLPDLLAAANRGARIRILTGTYLNITQPSALYLIRKEMGDRADLRLYNEPERSFHPKAYIFHFETFSEIFIGSSNISKSALTRAIEWNYRFSSISDETGYLKFFQTFEDLFFHHATVMDDAALKAYADSWHQPPALRHLFRYEESGNDPDPGPCHAGSDHAGSNQADNVDAGTVNADNDRTNNVTSIFTPRNAQIEALYALEKSRADGCDKGLIIAATGIGKTALAAFDSLNFTTVLFVAHREEILKKSARTFSSIRKSNEIGFFNAAEKCADLPVIMASVATLGSDRYLNSGYFPRDRFEYIVIDEVHHSAASQYQKILRYFRPKFLLGLTATPDRLDGRSIFELFDYNVPYRISLFTAINRGYLAPFRYYGVYDDTDYSGLRLVNGHYDSEDLNKTYLGNLRRHDLIFQNYLKRGSKRALGFCCSRRHAEEMAREFSERGVKSVFVCSNAEGIYSENRETAIIRLLKGEIRVIFSVDIFNEGVDIAPVDMVMFLRPTESPVVFLQQLGRGLRLHPDKPALTVLDFIGNYEKAGRIISILSEGRSSAARDSYGPRDLPDGCEADFDLRAINLFNEMAKKEQSFRDRILAEYCRIRDLLGRRPMRTDLFKIMDDALYRQIINQSKYNIFRNYLDFLKENNELTPEEQELCQGPGYDFLKMLETTAMTKVYKMPVLMAFAAGNGIKMQVRKTDLLTSWKDFFRKNRNWRDLENNRKNDRSATFADFLNIPDSRHLQTILKNPVNFLLKTEYRFFRQPEPDSLALAEEFRLPSQNPAFRDHFCDILEYRAAEYYRKRYDKENKMPEQD